MWFYRARKQLNLIVYTDFIRIHYVGDSCFVGYNRKLDDGEIEDRDLVILGYMSNEDFMEVYGTVQHKALFR